MSSEAIAVVLGWLAAITAAAAGATGTVGVGVVVSETGAWV